MSEHKRQGSLATYDLLDALERNPLQIQAGADICGEAAITIKELEAKLAVAVEIANSAVNALDEIQNYEQPNDPWAENALTMGELDAFDFSVFDARTTLAELKGDKKS
jgi:hypothetical protein